MDPGLATSAEVRLVDDLIDGLDRVRFGQVVEHVIPLVVQMVGKRRLAQFVGQVVELGIDEWNPPGPEVVDKLQKKVARSIAPAAASRIVLKILDRYDRG